MRNFRNLEIWHLGKEIVKLTYELLKKLPKNEVFRLKSQMQRAAISIPSNLAEGCSRSSNKDLTLFFEISIGSSFELETQMLASQLIGYINQADLDSILPKLTLFQKKTNTYIATLC